MTGPVRVRARSDRPRRRGAVLTRNLAAVRGSVEETTGGGPGMKMARIGLGDRIGSLTFWAAWAITLAAAVSARAGTIPQLPSNGVSPPFAAEVDELSKSVVEVNEAIKSFQKRDLDTCLQQLAKAVKAHPELPPAHALLAELALMSNQIALVRPALETAVAQAPDHPEIYILFGNLALLENRATDAALHFEKAKALALAERWTADQRRRFERFCHQGNALLAESRGDWKAARSALEAWLVLEPSNARARQRLGKALFSLDQQDEAYKELQKASKEDSALEPAEVMMGWLFTRAGNLKKAEEWMNYAVKTSPDSLPVQLAITSWLLEQGRTGKGSSLISAFLTPKPPASSVYVPVLEAHSPLKRSITVMSPFPSRGENPTAFRSDCVGLAEMLVIGPEEIRGVLGRELERPIGSYAVHQFDIHRGIAALGERRGHQREVSMHKNRRI